MKSNSKTIWIDLENTPHVLLFEPLKRVFESKGYKVLFTARDFAQTLELLNSKGLNYHSVGRQIAWGRLGKIASILVRSLQLFLLMRKSEVIGFLSHGSRSGIIAAKLCKLPIVTLGDYEYSYTKIDNKLSTLIMRPEVTDIEVLKSSGLDINKYMPYRGIKEDIYLSEFCVKEDYRTQLGIDSGTILCTLRPPATMAHYHDEKAIELMKTIVTKILSHPSSLIVALPRSSSDVDLIDDMAGSERDRIIYPEEALDGLNLIWVSDFVVSGGGTMNREAAALRVPVYSIFTGKRGSVDRSLVKQGKLKFIENETDVEQLQVQKRILNSEYLPENSDLKNEIADAVLNVFNGYRTIGP